MWVHTKFFNFSETKPFENYFKNSSTQYFLDYFTKNILIWKLINSKQQLLTVVLREKIKTKVDEIADMVKEFQKECIRRECEIIYPRLHIAILGNRNLIKIKKFQ